MLHAALQGELEEKAGSVAVGYVARIERADGVGVNVARVLGEHPRAGSLTLKRMPRSRTVARWATTSPLNRKRPFTGCDTLLPAGLVG